MNAPLHGPRAAGRARRAGAARRRPSCSATRRSELLPRTTPRVIDMCCGSGNLACALAARAARRPRLGQRPHRRLRRARAAQRRPMPARRSRDGRAGRPVRLARRAGLEGTIDLIVCNPPYISTAKLAGERAALLEHEPREAFDGGPYGLSIHQRVIRRPLPFLKPGGWLLFEIGLGQERQVKMLFERTRAYEDIRMVANAAGEVRVVGAPQDQPERKLMELKQAGPRLRHHQLLRRRPRGPRGPHLAARPRHHRLDRRARGDHVHREHLRRRRWRTARCCRRTSTRSSASPRSSRARRHCRSPRRVTPTPPPRASSKCPPHVPPSRLPRTTCAWSFGLPSCSAMSPISASTSTCSLTGGYAGSPSSPSRNTRGVAWLNGTDRGEGRGVQAMRLGKTRQAGQPDPRRSRRSRRRSWRPTGSAASLASMRALSRGLEQFDRVAVRIFHLDLFAGGTFLQLGCENAAPPSSFVSILRRQVSPPREPRGSIRRVPVCCWSGIGREPDAPGPLRNSLSGPIDTCANAGGRL